jgi:putrescine importer
LVAFTFVNLSVIAHFVIKQQKYKTARDIFSYLIMPLIGAALTGILWSNLHADALIGGVVWSLIGILYLLYQTKIRKNNIAVLDFEEAG